MDTGLLRTPSYRFSDLPDFAYTPQYVDVKEAVRSEGPDVTQALMGYVSVGSGENTILCLHGEASWSFLYRKLIPGLAEYGRVVVPDYIGFGRSDKLSRMEDHSYKLHRDTICELVETLDLRNITLVGHDWGGPFGLGVAVKHPERFDRFVLINSDLPDGTCPMSDAFIKWRKYAKENPDLSISRVIEKGLAINSNKGYVSNLPPEVLAAYEAPFPHATYKSGVRKFPLMVPIPEELGEASKHIVEISKRIQDFDKPALALFSKGDPIIPSGRVRIPELFSNTEEHIIKNAGHFVQEDASEEVVKLITQFIERSSVPQANRTA
jgi:haloalkane dehalogenase